MKTADEVRQAREKVMRESYREETAEVMRAIDEGIEALANGSENVTEVTLRRPVSERPFTAAAHEAALHGWTVAVFALPMFPATKIRVSFSPAKVIRELRKELSDEAGRGR